MEPELTPLSYFPSEVHRALIGGPQPPPAATHIEDCLAAFTREHPEAPATASRRSPSDESLTRLRLAVGGIQSEMSKLKSQRAHAQKEHVAQPQPRGLWRQAGRPGLFAGGVLLTLVAARLAMSVAGGHDAAATLTLSDMEPVEAAAITAPLAEVASRPLTVERPAVAAALRPPAVVPISPRRAANRATAERTATNGGSQPRAPKAFKGSLVINSIPQGATVLINQSPVGVTPLRLDDYPAGSYALWVQRDGYQRWTAAIMVPADRVTEVTSKLTRQE